MIPSISIIIPCYNASKYIDRCLGSLLFQTMQDYEIIVIDDGSVDDSLSKLQKFASQSSKIRVIHQENRGASAARNAGIKAANAPWLTFVDIDDYLESTYISHFFETSTVDAAVLKIQGLTLCDTESGVCEKTLFGSGAYEIGSGIINGRILHNGYSFGKLYNTRILQQKDLLFDENLSYKEDLKFMLMYIRHCQQIEFLPYSAYVYCRHAGSLSWTYHEPETLMTLNSDIRNRALCFLDDKNAYLQEYDRFCIEETIEAIFKSDADKRLRMRWLRKLRMSFGRNVYPQKYKSDKLLAFLWELKFFNIYYNANAWLMHLRQKGKRSK